MLARSAARALKPLAWGYGIYFVVIHVFLNSPILQRLIRQPNSVSVKWSWAFAPFPGWAHAHGYFMTIEDDNIQAGLRIEDISFWYDPLAFTRLFFRVTRADATGASFRVRLKRTPEEVAANPELIAALPPIEGFPSVAVKKPSGPPSNGNPQGIWTVTIEDAHAQATDLWIEGLRYAGLSYAYGRFTFQPSIHVDVDGRLRVLNGDLTFGARTVATGLTGSGSFVLDNFKIYEESGLQPLRHMHVQLALDGALQNARFLNPVLSRTPAPSLASSPGRFELLAKFEQGRIASGSTFRLRASDWQVAKGIYRSSGNYAQLEATVEKRGTADELDAAISLGPYEIDEPQTERELIDGSGLLINLSSRRLDIFDAPLTDLGFEIEINRAAVPDLRIINDFLPHSASWEILRGSGEATGAFTSPSTGSGHGNVHLSARDAAVQLRQLSLHGDFQFDAELAGVASDTRDIGLLGRDEFEGHGKLIGQFAVDSLRDPNAPLATFHADADIVLHPLFASRIQQTDLVHHLSGELKVDGKVPELTFLNGLLDQTHVRLAGGRGTLGVDLRLTHGILGRASELKFHSSSVSISTDNLHATGNVAVDAHVSERTDTPEVDFEARANDLTGGTTDLPSLVAIHVIRLHARSPEVDLATLTVDQPTAEVSIEEARLSALEAFNRWLPSSLQLSQGRAEGSGRLALFDQQEGSGQLDLRLSNLLMNVPGFVAKGHIGGTASLTGIAAKPWAPDALSRSHLRADLTASGQTHFLSKSNSSSSGRLTFTAEGRVNQPRTFSASAIAHEVSGRAVADGHVGGLAELNRFLGSSPLRIRGGAADLHVEALAENGQLAPGSRAQATSGDVDFLLGTGATTLGIGGPLEIQLNVGTEGSDRLRAVAVSPHLRLESRFRDQLYVDGGELKLTLVSASFTPTAVLRTGDARAALTGVALPHLEMLASLIPPLKGLVVDSGMGDLTAELHRDPSGTLDGRFALRVGQLAAEISKQRALANLSIDGRVAGHSADGLLPDSFDFSGTTVRIEHLNLSRDKDYWAEALVDQAKLVLSNGRPMLNGQFEIRARDALPLLHLYGSSVGVPSILDGMLAFNHLAGHGAVQIDSTEAVVPEFEVSGDNISFKGRLRRSAKHTAADFLLRLGPVAVGIDIRDTHTGFQLAGAENWYSHRLLSDLRLE